MSITRIKTKAGDTKWVVRLHESGRGSKRIKRAFDRKIDAEDFARAFQNCLADKKANPFSQKTFEGRTFKSEADYWFSDGKLRFAASHIKRIEGVFREILPIFGDLEIAQFTPEFLTAFQQQEKAKGLENATVNRKTEVITSIINHSVKHRRIPYSPAAGFRKLSVGTREMSFWTAEEAIGFLEVMNNRYKPRSASRWVYVVYFLALNTGMRAGEIWGLKAMDLSRAGFSILVRRQYNRVSNSFSQTKGKRGRSVPCNDVLRKEIFELIDKGSIKSDDTIFQTETGKPVCHDNFADRRFLADLKIWGGRVIRFHDLRHTAATLMIANGVDIKTVKEICGHADITTTMNYVHMLAGSVEKVARTFMVAPPTPEKAG